MTALLLVLILQTSVVIPMGVYTNSMEGRAHCYLDAAELQKSIVDPQQTVKCQLYELKAIEPYQPS